MDNTRRGRLRQRPRRSETDRRLRLEQLEDRCTPSTLLPGFTESVVADGLANPTAMDFAPDGRIFIAEQEGGLRVVKNGTLLATPFVTLAVDSSGERGLLGVAFDPAFATNHYVYVYYTVASGAVHNRVSRFTASGDVAAPGSETVLLELNNLSATNHNGGAIHFGSDGKLYIGVGENAVPSNAQTLSNLLGKILRINPDGSIPSDNPFFGTASGVNQAIWAIGLRNPFTFAVQPATGQIFINDVGQNTWEEINRGAAGANYGWPNTEGVAGNPLYTDPLFAYGHGSGDTLGCAIAGGAFYNPSINQFPSDYAGDYFFADLCSSWIRRFDPVDSSVTLFASDLTPLPVDLKVTPDGSLVYLARGGGSDTGFVGRISYSPPLGRIAGRVFADLNGDGVRQDTEPGLDGWTVFLDSDGSGTLEPGETNMVTDATGRYRFTGLVPGSYTVAQISRAGYTQTSPAGSAYAVTIRSAGGRAGQRDFGNEPPLRAAPLAGRSAALDDVTAAPTSDDLDHLFEYQAAGAGVVTVQIFFPNTSGDLDLEVRDASGRLVAASRSGGDEERVDFLASRGDPFQIRVLSAGTATNTYDLKITNAVRVQPRGAGRRLVVAGSEFDDTITLGQNGVGPTGNVRDMLLAAAGVRHDTTYTRALLNGIFGPDPYSRVVVRGNGGNDRITVDPSVALAASLVGDVGDDTLTGAIGNDALHGGDGTDSCTGGGGADSFTECESTSP